MTVRLVHGLSDELMSWRFEEEDQRMSIGFDEMIKIDRFTLVEHEIE